VNIKVTPKFKVGDGIKVVSGDYTGKSGVIDACTPVDHNGLVIAYEYTVTVNYVRSGKRVPNSMSLAEGQMTKL
jgi:transcription antitermination factor NusG